MIKGLGHLIRFMFGGAKPAPTSSALVVGARPEPQVEAPLASEDVLRKAMEAASVEVDSETPPPQMAPPMSYSDMEFTEPLPALFLAQTEAKYDAAPSVESVERAVFAELPVADLMAEVAQQPENLSDVPLEQILEEMASERFEPVTEPVAEERVVEAFDPTASVELIALTASVELESMRLLAVANERVQETRLEEPAVEFAAEVAVAEEPVAEVAVAEASEAPTRSKKAAAAKKPAAKPAAKKKPAAPAKRKKVVNAAPEFPADAVWMTDAVVWSLRGTWPEYWLPPTDAKASERIAELIAHAASGDIVIWGQVAGEGDPVAIPAAHWQTSGFEPLAFLAGRENALSEYVPAKGPGRKKVPVTYKGLKLSKSAIESLWSTEADAVRSVA